MPALQPYAGSVRKIVLGIDIGTTYSGVSYAILDHGVVPKIQGVTRFPGQENVAGNTKIPSILYYNPDGTVHSVGAEAAAQETELEAEKDGDLIFVQWFKLHLRPAHLDAQDDSIRRSLPPLPAGKSVVDVFSDFLAYLFKCTRTYICETHANGASLWSSLQGHIEFVLTHPNGWEGFQQGRMRQAAVMAELIPDTPAGHARVHFVTEGEASLNFCIRNGLTDELVGEGKAIMIVDAGGGTVDVSTYLFTSVDPLSVEEIVSADCILQGSTRVTVRAEEFLRERLKNSKYGNDEDIKCMRDYFDKSTKTVFRSANEPYYIKFGSMGCHDLDFGIRRGKLMLSGTQMLSFFKPSLAAIVQVILRQRQATSRPLAAILLVGGFAASPWLYSTLQEELSLFGLPLFRPDAHTSKAVAEGAVSYHLEHFVSARVMKMTYGIEVSVRYDSTNPEHYARQAHKYVRASGRVMLRKGFSTIVGKGKSMLEGEEVSSPYLQEAHRSSSLDSVAVDILCYRGKDVNPLWVDVHPLMYAPLCTIYADTSRVVRVQKRGLSGTYYEQKFKVILISGLTELQAQISWIEDGVEKRGPASIVYDDDLQVSP